MGVYAKYAGRDGAHHHGIPARDLTEEEHAALDADRKALVESSPLYERHEKADIKPPKGGE